MPGKRHPTPPKGGGGATASPQREELGEIVRGCGLDRSSVLAAYILGSQLWGTEGPASDLDVLVVVRGSAPKKTTHVGRRYDVSILGEDAFRDRCKEQRFPELLCQHLCGSHVLLPARAGFAAAAVVPARLVDRLEIDAEKDLERAAKLMDKGDVNHSRKVICHALRQHHLALQLLRSGDALNFTALQHIHQELGLRHPCAAQLTGNGDGWLMNEWQKAMQEVDDDTDAAARALLQRLRHLVRAAAEDRDRGGA
eukprot:TRINITY_DN3593_c0_g1_i1.p1 TRINITY_DN3593_c0_g1~~TRINITY_DN3593_c0_g1_i1.p1  ORF type:complete len:270 (+),score=43.90 TRINITY_DN3593_c0_g1_i1:50-811(+)